MASAVILPRQGQSVESCLILEWKKKEGDAVKEGEIICEVETDKATFEVEATAGGTILKNLYGEGDDVAVLAPISVIGNPGDDIEAALKEAGAGLPETEPKDAVSEAETADAPAPPAAIAAVPAASDGRIFVSPRARVLSAAKGVALEGMIGSGPEGRIIERDILKALEGREPLTPAAAAALIEKQLTAPPSGTGPGGRITSADIAVVADLSASSVGMAAATSQEADLRPAAFAGRAEFPGPTTTTDVVGIRKIISERMLGSMQTTAQVSFDVSADARSILEFRKKLKNSNEEMGLTGITLNDMVLFSTAKSLMANRKINSHFHGDRVVEFEHVHLGIAVDTPRGLMVPVMRFADQLTLKEISIEAKRLIEGCRKGGISPDELSGATFTVTNLGAMGIESFTPIINPPEVGILGVNKIMPKPVLGEDGSVDHIPFIVFSLTANHQLIDGAVAARFLLSLKTAIANFDLTLSG
jgi:pyruvate dehydrogenase E2 component (dihydrolipoamide acetyltransferase)